MVSNETIVVPENKERSPISRRVLATLAGGLALVAPIACGSESADGSSSRGVRIETAAEAPDSTTSPSTTEEYSNDTDVLAERLEIINPTDPEVPDIATGYIRQLGEAKCGEEDWKVGVDNIGDVYAQAPDQWLFNLTKDYYLFTPERDDLIKAAVNHPDNEFNLDGYIENEALAYFCSGD